MNHEHMSNEYLIQHIFFNYFQHLPTYLKGKKSLFIENSPIKGKKENILLFFSVKYQDFLFCSDPDPYK